MHSTASSERQIAALAAALVAAVREHGAPNAFSLTELETLHGAPNPVAAGRIGVYHLAALQTAVAAVLPDVRVTYHPTVKHKSPAAFAVATF